MTPLNFNYISELDSETKDLLNRGTSSKRAYRNHLTIPTSSLSTTGSEYLTVTNARKAKWDKNIDVIRLNVLTCNGGICVTVRYTDPLIYERYRQLLKIMKNGIVEITFPYVEINASSSGTGLYFTSSDFKIKDPTVPAKPTIFI